MGNTKSSGHNRALILGVDDRSALTIVRSLGRKGAAVHLGIDRGNSICRHSRYASKVIYFPSAGKTPELWLQKLSEQLSAESYDLVIPVADKYLVPIVQNREKLEKLARFAIPDERGFLYSYNKSKTLELAESLGVPCPRTTPVERFEDIEKILREFQFPLILKPVSSKVWSENVRHDLQVELARDEDELGKKLRRILPLCPALIQSFHKGAGVGQEFLMNCGEVVAAFQHERIHEPRRGGGSSYRKSMEIDPALLNHSLRMLRELNWTGVAMVEYKQDKESGESVLMEINGRFWGSLPLPVAAGADFPAWLFDMLVNNKFPPKVEYRKNLFCRNPVRDLEWLKENFRADRTDPFSQYLPWRKLFREVKNLLLLRERWDTIVWDDPLPGIRQLLDYFKRNALGAGNKLQRAAIEADFRYNLIGRYYRQGKLARLLRKNGAVAFICKGNICRSPFAGIYLAALLRKNNPGNFSAESYGLLPRENRRSPELAVAAAENFGVDMSGHRSRILSEEAVEKAGALFVMDIELYRQVKRLYPQAEGKLFLLGVLQNGGAKSIEIIDPYGGNIEKFRKVFLQITQSVDNLVELAKN